ncbi:MULTISPECIES: low molecular weight protein-tyrosine-phosphatase [Oleiagrimonas]|uniref:low molecular weight protein-tyrosine-phosphatase n=1 Tax=Oleiagrimonas TaxID=1649642 RepID=UPI000DC465DE|nr:low molecular weight protein-tyrosine-phosphatase [Oleiagrimonas sp. MCCC 1A03011]RAP57827.1 phosphotyrosine protein phosphatase [Oleiagrimonas sp. MCCC 1A03011]
MSEGQGVLFVCLGNICRSPLAEAVARLEFERAGLNLPVDSCGTGGWHAGEGADPRSVRAGAEAGYDLSPHRARRLEDADFTRWRWLLAMDAANLDEMRTRCPSSLHGRLGLFLDVAGVRAEGEVPDPYYGGREDFRAVLNLARDGVQGLIERLRVA